MSESKKKKTGQSADTPVVSTRVRRDQRRAQAEKEARRSRNTYIAVGIACLALAIFAVAWGSGIIQRSTTAVTVNGHKYTAAEVQYYYYNIKNMYLSYGILDSSTDPRDSVVNEETGATMYDSMMESALANLEDVTALCDKAEAEGFTLPAGYQKLLEQNMADMEEAWQSRGYASLTAMLRASYGNYMTKAKYQSILEDSMLATAYQESIQDGFEITDEELETYYSENKDNLDTFTLTTFVFTASVKTTDDEGNTIDMTDEEKTSALEEAKTPKKALAEELKTKLEAGEDPAALAEEYADDLTTSSVSQRTVGSSVSGTTYGEWALDSARANGDITIAEPEQDDSEDATVPTSYTYTVVRWEGRERSEEATNSVRHILIAAEQDEDADEPTEEQYAAAKEQAEALLEEWKSGEATEQSFADLAMVNSADSGSAMNGGLIRNITENSSYVETFRDWAIDPARKTGDTGIVQNTGSSTKGWHIMYYIKDDPTWKITADSALRSDKVNEWHEGVIEGYDSTQGLGMKFVTP